MTQDVIRPRGETRERVRQLIAHGLTVGDIARRLGVTPTAVSYHARKLGIPSDYEFGLDLILDGLERMAYR